MHRKSSHRIATFEATCGICGKTFAAPSLGDFAYGQFLFFGERGTVYAYLDAIDHPVCRFVESAVGNDGDTIRRILARIADPVDGQKLSETHVCPHCHSADWRSWEGKRVDYVDVAEVSFDSFNRLSDDERIQRISRPRYLTAIQTAIIQFNDRQRPWTFHDAVISALSANEKQLFEIVWQAAMDDQHWKSADLQQGAANAAAAVSRLFPQLDPNTIKAIVNAAAYQWK